MRWGLRAVAFAVAIAASVSAQAQVGYEFGIRFQGVQFRPQSFSGFGFSGQSFRGFSPTPIQFDRISFPALSSRAIRRELEREAVLESPAVPIDSLRSRQPILDSTLDRGLSAIAAANDGRQTLRLGERSGFVGNRDRIAGRERRGLRSRLEAGSSQSLYDSQRPTIAQSRQPFRVAGGDAGRAGDLGVSALPSRQARLESNADGRLAGRDVDDRSRTAGRGPVDRLRVATDAR